MSTWRFLAVLALLLGLSIPSHAGHVSSGGAIPRLGGTPTLGTCGTSPSVTGTDSGGVIQVGSGAIGTCTLTFSVTYATAPSCVVSINSVIAVQAQTVSTSALVVTGTSLTSVKIWYACVLP
jgi:hypothetical protein